MKGLDWGKQFKKDLKLAKKRGKDLEDLWDIVKKLQKNEPLPSSCKDHALENNWRPFRDLHIEPDWLLIYDNQPEIIILIRTGTHSDLF